MKIRYFEKIDKIMTVGFNHQPKQSHITWKRALVKSHLDCSGFWVCLEGIIFILLSTVGRLSLKVGSAIPGFGSWVT